MLGAMVCGGEEKGGKEKMRVADSAGERKGTVGADENIYGEAMIEVKGYRCAVERPSRISKKKYDIPCLLSYGKQDTCHTSALKLVKGCACPLTQPSKHTEVALLAS